MHIYSHLAFAIMFCDKKNSFNRDQFYGLETGNKLLLQAPFQEFSNILKTLITVHQVHKTDGLIITSLEQAVLYKPYSAQADFIITNVPDIGIGIATADCLPIIFFDNTNNVIAVVHAGWKGTMQGIVLKVIGAMQEKFGTQLNDLQIFFGPCASVENYEVSADFGENVMSVFECFCDGKNVSKNDAIDFTNKVFIYKNNRYFFSIPLYNQLLLEQIGILKTAFILNYCHCTIANQNFCSYRRDKNNQRQMTIAYLKKR